MAGYATAMRIERIEIRGGLAARGVGANCEPVEQAQAVTVIELVGIEPGSGIRERLDGIRIHFGQLTWYLFNAEGWR